MMPGGVDMLYLDAMQKIRDDMRIKNERLHQVYLKKAQMETKPISSRDFCLKALLFASDNGYDFVDRDARRTVIGLALHPRVGRESRLGAVSDNVLCMIAQMI